MMRQANDMAKGMTTTEGTEVHRGQKMRMETIADRRPATGTKKWSLCAMTSQKGHTQ